MVTPYREVRVRTTKFSGALDSSVCTDLGGGYMACLVCAYTYVFIQLGFRAGRSIVFFESVTLGKH